MTEVFAVMRDVRHEGATLIGIYGTADKAIEAVQKRCDEQRSNGEWTEWSNGGGHIVSYRNQGTTFIVKQHTVQ